jgi:hypothetical protein
LQGAGKVEIQTRWLIQNPFCLLWLTVAFWKTPAAKTLPFHPPTIIHNFLITLDIPPSESQKIIYNIFKNPNISYKNLTYKLKKF